MMTRLGSYLLAGAVLAAASLGGVAQADIIQLSDGSKVTGTLSRRGEMMVITSMDGKQQTLVKASEIASVTLTSTITPAEKADGAWKSLQPQINKAAKIEDVITLLTKFEKENHGTPAAEKAQISIDNYRILQAQEAVKFRGVWVAKAQVEVLLRGEVDQAKPIIATYKAGKMKEALEQSREALKTSPQNPHVLIVAGLASYRLNQLLQAREFFTKMLEVNDTSVIGLNNLAVVSFQLSKPVEALVFYTRALAAAPDNRLLVDNIVEALAAAENLKAAPQYVALQRQFLQAETNLQAKNAKEGLFRYGSTWVTQQQHDRLVANRNAMKASLDAVEMQYNEAARTLNNVEARITQAKSDVDTAANDYNYWIANAAWSPYYDPNALVRRDMAQADLERARRRLSTLLDQRAAAIDTINKVKADAAKIKQAWTELDHDQLTGVQRIMDLGDDELTPPPSAISVPPVVEKPAERPAAPIFVQDIPQQQVQDQERRTIVPVSEYGYGQTIQYGTWGSVVPPLIIGPGAVQVFVRPGKTIYAGGGGMVGGNILPTVPLNSPAIPMFTPAGSGR